jgi:hypothetical protein
MTHCDYQILEYTTSELRTQGVPFIVVVRTSVLDSYTLTGYVFRNWKMKIGAASKSDLDDVEIFVKDLRHHCRNQDSVSSFFDSLEGLSVGPLRALVFRSCSFKDLDEVFQVFFNEMRGSSSWIEHFEILSADALI